jgi:hypothetical protein
MSKMSKGQPVTSSTGTKATVVRSTGDGLTMTTAAEMREKAAELERQASAAAEAAAKLKAEAKRAEIQERREAEARRQAEQAETLWIEVGSQTPYITRAVHDLIYGEAYSEGHGYGASEVAVHYGRLADFAERVIAAGK